MGVQGWYVQDLLFDYCYVCSWEIKIGKIFNTAMIICSISNVAL